MLSNDSNDQDPNDHNPNVPTPDDRALNGQDATEPDQTNEPSIALVAVLMELERHVGSAGWDHPPRLFALVPTDDFIVAEPVLAEQLSLRGSSDGGRADELTAVEQDHFAPTGDLLGDLAELEWPPSVSGCALATIRTFLPSGFEGVLPEDPAEASRVVAEHPDRQEIRVVVGVQRDGQRHGVARIATQPQELLAAEDLVPGLADALAATLT